MYTYEPKKFNLPSMEGISDESVKQHLGLYEGYVKNFNAITGAIGEYLSAGGESASGGKDSEKNAHALSELVRRRSFEFGGMRLHENYFAQFEGSQTAFNTSGALATALAGEFGSVETAVVQIKQVGMMRGPGWSILYFDPVAKSFQIGFTGEQHQGHFVTLPIILALDVWEHAFILDYGAQGKGKYIDAFFKNLNWDVMEKRYSAQLG